MTITTTHERFLSIEEAATYLSTKVSWIHQNHKHKQMPSYKIGRKLIFKVEELDCWIENQKTV